MSLTSSQKSIIKATVPVLAEHGLAITKLFYKNLLREIPSLNDVFNTANQANGAQPGALAYSLHAYAQNIDDLAALSAFVERVNQKHASLYVRPEQYQVVGRYLLAAMGNVLGDALTPEILEAWTAAYWQLANLMITREAEIYSQEATWSDWRSFRIVRKVHETAEITSFYLAPTDGKRLPMYRPGQYISVQVDVESLKYSQARQYSLSRAARVEGDSYRISVKREKGLSVAAAKADGHNAEDIQARPGYVSNVLHDHKHVGDVVQVSHPAGEFYLEPTSGGSDVESASYRPDHPVVLISAGVGITPMMAMLEAMLCTSAAQERVDGYAGTNNGSKAKTVCTCPFTSDGDANANEALKTSGYTGSTSVSTGLQNGHASIHTNGHTVSPSPQSKNVTISSTTAPKIHFIHATRSSLHIPFLPHLQSLQHSHPAQLRLTIFNPSPSPMAQEGLDWSFRERFSIKRLQKDGLLDSALEDEGSVYFVCGPEGFMADVRRGLESAGVERERVRVENFGAGV